MPDATTYATEEVHKEAKDGILKRTDAGLLPEASLCVSGKPDRAGGPVTHTLRDTWKPVHAGGYLGDTVRSHRRISGRTGGEMGSVREGGAAGA